MRRRLLLPDDVEHVGERVAPNPQLLHLLGPR
jgi:hypothetical protein